MKTLIAVSDAMEEIVIKVTEEVLSEGTEDEKSSQSRPLSSREHTLQLLDNTYELFNIYAETRKVLPEEKNKKWRLGQRKRSQGKRSQRKRRQRKRRKRKRSHRKRSKRKRSHK